MASCDMTSTRLLLTVPLDPIDLLEIAESIISGSTDLLAFLLLLRLWYPCDDLVWLSICFPPML